MSNILEQPYVNDLNIDFNPEDLKHSIGIPLAIEDYEDESISLNYDDKLHIPSSPPSPQSQSFNKHSIQTEESLSKKLFNLEHYITIPLMFLLSFFVYYDRGGLSAALDSVQEQLLNDNAFKSGAIASCYLFGYCFTCPIFAIFGSKHPPLKMSSIGMVLWCIGAFLTGWPNPAFISPFIWIAGARLLTGIGEASFLAFAATIIDIIAPDTSRALWLGTFYMGIPLGYAMGYAVGGSIADMSIYITHNCNQSWYDDENVTDCNESWRAIFITETFCVLPLCIILYVIKQPDNMLIIKQAKDELNDELLHNKNTQISDAPIFHKIMRVISNKTFIFTSLGYALQTFVTGTFGVEAITYLQKVYKWNASKAGTTFGIITFVAGVFGSIFGGFVLDKLKSQLPQDSNAYMYCKPALKLLIVLGFISFPCAFIIVLYNSIPVFIIGAFFAEFFIFASQGPVNNVILWCTLYEDRPLASALNTLAIHALGDACAPLAVGAVINASKNNGKSDAYAYNFAFGIAVFWLIFSGVAFFLGLCTINWLEQWMTIHGENEKKTSLLINE